jgi:hypothetical protein
MNLDIGQRIRFRAATRWATGTGVAVRVIRGFKDGCILVKYGGWSDFRVRHDEVLEVIEK